MYTCPACQRNILVFSHLDVLSHLNMHKLLAQLDYPIKCLQPGCKSTIGKIDNYIRHFQKFHKCDIDKETVVPLVPGGIEIRAQEMEVDNDEPAVQIAPNVPTPPAPPSFLDIINELKESMSVLSVTMMAELRANGNIPLNVSVGVVKYVSSFVDLIVEKISLAVQTATSTFKNNLLDVTIKEFGDSFKDITAILPKLVGSEFRIKKACEKNPQFVMPQSLPLGSREETVLSTVNGESKVTIVTRYNNAQYVSIESTLRAELRDPTIRKLVLAKPIVKEGLYDSFQAGTLCRNHELLSDPSKHVIGLQVFYDGLGITNFARDAAKLHNSGMFYFSILNLPPGFTAALSNIHLVAMCNTMDLKDEGLNIIAEKIVDECNRLATRGMIVETEDGPTTIFATIVHFTGDNLGLNQIFGFIESFSADFCCLMCYATREQMQTFEKESAFELRTVEQYDNDVSQLDDLPPGKNHFRGVKAPSFFNDLIHFYVCTNWVNDPMHTVTEGINLQVNGNVLYSISKLDPHLTVASFNQELSILFNGFIVDRHNKPYLLNSFLELDKGMSPKQSSAQQMVISRYIPYILFRIVKNEACLPYIELLLLLQEITDLVFAPRFTDSLLIYFSNLIEKFIILFKQLYPESPIRPKMHFLIHYPSIIKRNGPMRAYWCMNYERMNGAVKVPSHIMKNFKDPQKTLAYRRQCAAFHARLERQSNRNFVSIGKITFEEIEHIGINFTENYLDHLRDFELDIVCVSNKVTVNGTEYRNGTVVVLGFDGLVYIFGYIEFVIVENIEKPLLFVTLFDTINIHDLSFCYLIKKRFPSTTRLCSIADLLDPQPLDLIRRDEEKFVRLKYRVIGNV